MWDEYDGVLVLREEESSGKAGCEATIRGVFDRFPRTIPRFGVIQPFDDYEAIFEQ